MVSINKFFSSVFLAVVYASITLAAPSAPYSKHSTHSVISIRDGLNVETFHPKSVYETFGAGVDHPLSKRDNTSLSDSTIAFVQQKLGVPQTAIKYKAGYDAHVCKYAFVAQVHESVPFANAVANVAFSPDNKVVAFGSSFVKPSNLPSSKPSVNFETARSTAEKVLKGKFNDHPPTVEFFAKQDGSVVLTHVIQVQDEKSGAFFEAFVDAHSNELVGITDFVTKASYKVLPISKELPTEGFEVLTDPQNCSASPLGWHNDGTQQTTVTSGNNAIAFKGDDSGVARQSSDGLNFIYDTNLNEDPTSEVNVAAAIVNAFYISNTMHDIAYLYGFTEEAFNFQVNNFNKGGQGNDPVRITVQDASGIDNAFFVASPDGQPGQLRLFLFDKSTPFRDTAIENDIVVHEFTHGITSRMIGGGTGRCLQTLESGGLGEGLSDAIAEWTEQKSAEILDYKVGQFAGNNANGIRSHPYSTSEITNPLRYSDVAKLNEVHAIGEVWANILHNVYAALVNQHGFSANAKTDASGTEGNVVFLHLFMDALALQPCNPTFTSSRDAWIQADQNRFQGANRCLLLTAFASRGLGLKATPDFKDDTSIPDDC